MTNFTAHLTTFLVAIVAGFVGGYVSRGNVFSLSEVRTRNLAIVDSHGDLRAAVALAEGENSVEFRMLDRTGVSRAGIAVNKEGGAVISLGSPQLNNSIFMVASANGQAHLAITNSWGKPVLTFGTLPGGPIGLTIHDGKSAAPRVQAGSDRDGVFGVLVTDDHGKPVWGGPLKRR